MIEVPLYGYPHPNSGIDLIRKFHSTLVYHIHLVKYQEFLERMRQNLADFN